ncbi:androglobin-like isoform X11 [Mytilus edulis]|uniref:androglobin-like isoform X11 n=1 Tax=Mytilus edulis TaxID=6550 RepID=UPI0039EFEB39
MSRRSSVTPSAAKRHSDPRVGKRVSLRDNTLSVPSSYRQSLGDIRDGDTYYKTVHSYPSVSDVQDITVSIARLGMHRQGSAAPDSRRGSMLSESRAISPMPGAGSPMQGFESPMPEYIMSRAASIAASAGGTNSTRPQVKIWPEWTESELAAEKWDGKGGKTEKGKSPVASQLFDDPEGKIDMPSSLKVAKWVRAVDFMAEKVDSTPVVVDPDGMASFDLIKANEHIHESELMRYIISQVSALWEMSLTQNPPTESVDPAIPMEALAHTWRPWEHIYTSKPQKGPHVPQYSAYGKYVVKLYWMGCWRKLTVDDSLPLDENDRLLLPATTMSHELWPMLLTKALIKIASLDYAGGSSSSEFGDCSIVQCLTGWIPESIPLQSFVSSSNNDPFVPASQVLDKYFQLSSQAKDGETPRRVKSASDASQVVRFLLAQKRYGHVKEVWELLKVSLPEWKLPLQEWEKELLEQQELEKKGDEASSPELAKEDKSEKDASSKAEKDPKAKDGKDKGKDPKEKEKGKDKDKKDKDKDKDKKGDKEKTGLEDNIVPEKPEVVVFATYWSPSKYPVKVSVMGEMANASEKLRQNGLSHLYPHPVCITQTRSCPLEPPPPPEKIPAWKLIRPKKKKTTPSDEPVAEPEPPKPIECLEITSPFVNYKVSPVPIPTETHRPKSSLERGGTRSRPGTANPIEETDENAPEQEVKKVEEVVKPPEEPVPVEEPVEPVEKPSTPGKEKRKSSGTKRDKDIASREASPGPKKGSAGKPERTKSARSESRSSKTDEKEKPKAPPSESGGLAPPPPADSNATTPDPNAEEGAGEEKPEEEKTPDNDASKPKKVWLDFEQFCKCFKTLYIYHKPNTYKYNHKHGDLKNVTPSVAPIGKGDKKGAPTAAGVNTSSSKTSQTPTHSAPSPTNLHSSSGDDRSPNYLFVDNLKPTDIVILFSAISRLHEPPPLAVDEPKKPHTAGKRGDKPDLEKDTTNMTDLTIDGSVVGRTPAPPPPVTPGTLVAEPYSWKSLVTGQPILRLRTTGNRAAVLSLPPGRHVLRFMMSSPLGHTVHLCSTIPFVFGDEESVMKELRKESCRFVDNATQVINCIGKCINSFSDPEGFKQNWEELVTCHCPYRYDKTMSKQHHFQIFNQALYHTLKDGLSEMLSHDLAFAWRTFTFDAVTKNILGLPTSSRPGTGGSTRSATKPVKGEKDKDKKGDADKKREADKAENQWANREMTPDEQIALVKIQRNWRGSWVRKMTQARTPGTEVNKKVSETLQKSWAVLEQNAEQYGLSLFRYMFKLDPDVMVKYPFHKDEWNKISYDDYSGQYPDHPPNSWFVVFRDIFHVTEEMLAVPKMYVGINTCMLQVINNDTGEEIPRVFQKVAPHVYKKNKKGYTFVATARTTDQGIPSGRWRMRMIGSLSPLPKPDPSNPSKSELNSNFRCIEEKDYYIPNPKNVILRYTVKVLEDHVGSIQLNTSKTDVYIKLTVLDKNVEVASTTGKGHAVLPAFIFYRDYDPNDPRPSSRASNKDSKEKGGKGGSKENVGKGGKRTSSAKSIERTASRSSHHSDAALSDGEGDQEVKSHKYVIQATVEKDSWPLGESSWAFVQMLKEMEKNDLKTIRPEEESDLEVIEEEKNSKPSSGFKNKMMSVRSKMITSSTLVKGPTESNDVDVANKERPASPPKQEKVPASASTNKSGAKGGKGGKDKGKDKDKDGKGSRPPSQAFDQSKPHWTLRVVSDDKESENIEVKKDTERADEIRAMKKAWETAQPGRAAKALQSRLKYLSTHTIKLHPDKEEEEGGEEKKSEEEGDVMPPPTPMSLHEAGDENLTLEPPRPPTPKEMLAPLDVSPFIRKGSREPRYLDDEEIRRRDEEQKQEVDEYNQFRNQVKTWRDTDKQNRNQIKIRQLEECEELQVILDKAREEINKPREAFRQTYLEAERKRLEDLAEKEAASKAESETKSPKRGKSAKGNKSPGGGKKKK